jgi:hypothetical protein
MAGDIADYINMEPGNTKIPPFNQSFISVLDALIFADASLGDCMASKTCSSQENKMFQLKNKLF